MTDNINPKYLGEICKNIKMFLINGIALPIIMISVLTFKSIIKKACATDMIKANLQLRVWGIKHHVKTVPNTLDYRLDLFGLSVAFKRLDRLYHDR